MDEDRGGLDPVAQESQEPERRSSCDICARRKRKCGGGDPCAFCQAANLRCTYSVKGKSGRRKKAPIVNSEGSLQAAHSMSTNTTLDSTMPGAFASCAVVDSSLSFQASICNGLVGFQENGLIKMYLRELNQMLPLTNATSVSMSVREVVSSGVVIRDPTDAVRCSKLAMFWCVCSIGSRIAGYTEAMTEGYKARAADALQYCYTAHIKEVAEALLILGALEGMQGHTQQADMYRGFAEMSHILLRQHAEKHPHMVFDGANENIYSERFGSLLEVYGPKMLDTHEAKAYVPTIDVSIEGMVREHYSRPSADPVCLLRMHVGVQKYVLVALDPASSLSDVSAALTSMDLTWNAINLSRDKDNAASAVPYLIWHGITRVMMGNIDIGLKCIEWGIEMALNFSGLVTYPFWFHGFHCAAITLYHHNRLHWYAKLVQFYNPATFPGSELPQAEDFDMRFVCREGHLCHMLSDWLCKYQPSGALNVQKWHPFETALQENPYAHAHGSTPIHALAHTHTFTHPTHAHAHIPVNTHAHMHLQMNPYAQGNTPVIHRHVCMHMQTHRFMQLSIHMHSHIPHIHIYL